jgi:hypothetical protein
MKFYSRKKKYKYSTGFLFFWKFRAKDGRWRQRQIYWGNRETEHITSRYDCIKNIAQLSDGLERKSLIRRTPWLNRGVEDYSDEFFSQSIYLRLQELKKQTAMLPKQYRLRNPYTPRKEKIVSEAGKLADRLNAKFQTKNSKKRERINKFAEEFCKFKDLYEKDAERYQNRAIKKANRIREFGEKIEVLTGKKRFRKRDFEKYQAAFPAGSTLKFCQLAIRTWHKHPDPINDAFQMEDFVSKMVNLKNKPVLDGAAINQLAVKAALSSLKNNQNLVPTNSVSVKARKSQFYWDFFK